MVAFAAVVLGPGFLDVEDLVLLWGEHGFIVVVATDEGLLISVERRYIFIMKSLMKFVAAAGVAVVLVAGVGSPAMAAPKRTHTIAASSIQVTCSFAGVIGGADTAVFCTLKSGSRDGFVRLTDGVFNAYRGTGANPTRFLGSFADVDAAILVTKRNMVTYGD